MPKLKTRKAVKKRFRVTKKGKVVGSRSLKRHMLTDRSPKKKRQARRPLGMDKTNVKAIRLRLPYGE